MTYWVNLALWFVAGAYTTGLWFSRLRATRLLDIADGENARLHSIIDWARASLGSYAEALKKSNAERSLYEQSADAYAAAVNYAIDCSGAEYGSAWDAIGFLTAWRDGEWGVIAKEWPEFDLTTARLSAETIAGLKEYVDPRPPLEEDA